MGAKKIVRYCLSGVACCDRSAGCSISYGGCTIRNISGGSLNRVLPMCGLLRKSE